MGDPEGVAAAWLSELAIESPPVDVDRLAEEVLALDVQEHADLRALLEDAPASALSGLLLPDEGRIYVDATEAARSPGRRRFTVAHELGHWHLHRHGKGAHTRFCRPEDIGGARDELRLSRAIEAEANRFAAALLMPESTLRRVAPELRFSVPALARQFGVSAIAMQVRLEVLDLLPDYMRR